MPLTAGVRMGPYEIVSAIGVGGMGEVYKARDTRLDRDVAIKVLPPHLASDNTFRERFEREARAISSLHHPHICVLHDVGNQDGVHYLVLEYLEGESLSQRLERGSLPIAQVLRYGIQIAEALERAHRQGVVHRDLKPGNIMLTKDGVKLLDFGLAKPMAGASAAPSSMSMTVTRNQTLTAQGTIVGTFQYMAPEQLEGHDADPRSDLFALGCVLYEMAAGKRPFEGKTQASVVAAIFATEPPPISSIQPLTPPAFERVVKVCVAKDPEERWQTAHDVKLQLKWIAEGGSQAGVAAPVAAHRKHREWTAWILAGLCLLLAIGAGAAYWGIAGKPKQVVRTALLLPEKSQFTLMGRNGAPVISPDGTRVAFVAVYEGQRAIWLRPLDSTEAKPVAGTDEGYAPFWSPDGRYLAYFTQGKLKRIAVNGGAPEVICDADDVRGGTWGTKDVILFAPSRFSPIYSVPANGGTPTPVTELGTSLSHRWPHFLPDGDHFLFLSTPTGSASTDSRVMLGSVKDKTQKIILDSPFNVEFSAGNLFFVRDGTLNAQPFDFKTGTISGEAVPIANGIQVDSLYSHALFSISSSGMLVFAPGSVSGLAQLTWYDRKGKELGFLGEGGLFIEIAISADDSKVAAVEFKRSNIDLWIYELARGVHTRLTTVGANRYPIWSPDGNFLVYGSSNQNKALRIFRKAVNGDSPPEQIADLKEGLIPTSWSHDGRFIAFTNSTPFEDSKQDILTMSMEGDHKLTPFMRTPFNERAARFSPDGKWVAYSSDESGRYEVYQAPFPGGGRKWQVSNAGGSQPLWSKNGTELYYFAPDNTIMAVSVSSAGAEPRFGVPTALFKAPPRNFNVSIYDVTRDGKFLISSAPDESTAPLTLISNWPTLLQK
ncbi:MAG: protein kinase [Acidobacteriales bacterium]|nr:protein kinase [Terriglobales bacterium]